MGIDVQRTKTRDIIMKMTTALLTTLILLGVAQPGSTEDLLQGFAGRPWGSSREAFQDLRESARSGDIRYYRRSEDAYRIGGVTLPDVVYGFYQDQYFAAYMKVPSPAEFESIKGYLESRYGKPRAQLRIDQTIYIWDYIDAKIKLKHYENQPQAKLAFYHVPLSTKANLARAGNDAVKVLELDEYGDYDF
jgi:hypothetical protein